MRIVLRHDCHVGGRRRRAGRRLPAPRAARTPPPPRAAVAVAEARLPRRPFAEVVDACGTVACGAAAFAYGRDLVGPTAANAVVVAGLAARLAVAPAAAPHTWEDVAEGGVGVALGAAGSTLAALAGSSLASGSWPLGACLLGSSLWAHLYATHWRRCTAHLARCRAARPAAPP